MKAFVITTNKATAKKIISVFNSVISIHRSIRLGNVSHHPSPVPSLSSEGFSIVQILAKENEIDPVDIFWLGYFTGFKP